MTGRIEDQRRSATIDDFLARYFRDEDAGATRSLEEYQREYPGLEDAIATAWKRVRQDSDEPTGRRLPEQIGAFRVLERLGGGGQGVVFLAEDTRLGRQVAIKSLGATSGSWDTTAIRRLQREAELASRLAHPGICPVHELVVEDGMPYVVMPVLAGESLAKRIADAPLATDHALALIEQVARATHFAHERGIVHRDIKPSNIMVDGNRAIVMDFGIARHTDAENRTLTATGDLLGTLPYMAPEQIHGRSADRRADIYAIGVTLYQTLTGRLPFDGRTQRELMNAIVHETPADLRRVAPGVPHDLSIVLEVALEKDPDGRFRTAADFADELRRVREHRPIESKRASNWTRIRRWCQRDPKLAWTVFGLFLTLTTALLISLALLASVAAERTRKQAALNEIDMLTDRTRLQELTSAIPEFEPPRPEAIRAMDEWLTRADAIGRRVPRHETLLRVLRDVANPYDENQKRLDRRSHPLFVEIVRLREARTYVKKELDSLDAAPEHEEQRTQRQRELEAIETAIDRAEEAIGGGRSWKFDDRRDGWRHGLQDALVTELRRFFEENPFGLTRARVIALREMAKRIGKRAKIDESAWRTCIEQIADRESFPHYGGLQLQPQLGLVPLGSDPVTKLFEFAELATGSIPKRDARGKLQIRAASAIVFVLVPSGRARIGATRPGPGETADVPHVDAFAKSNESPVHAVRLDAFLLSKFEVTQAQWLRLTNQNPSQTRIRATFRGQPAVTGRHPVEGVSWDYARGVLARLGLELPTSVQWEYAARAGTATPFYSGTVPRSLAGYENVADRAFGRSVGQRNRALRYVDDGWVSHAPVGSFRSNAFGLHDMLGNVQEWCLDRNQSYRFHALPGDGLRIVGGAAGRIVRGASYLMAATDARCAAFRSMRSRLKRGDIGLRPVRPLAR